MPENRSDFSATATQSGESVDRTLCSHKKSSAEPLFDPTAADSTVTRSKGRIRLRFAVSCGLGSTEITRAPRATNIWVYSPWLAPTSKTRSLRTTNWEKKEV